MDFSRFKVPDWLIVGGALGFLIFGFFPWVNVDFEGIVSTSDGNVFDFFWTGIVPWILIIGAGVVHLLLKTGKMNPGNVPWTLIILAATVLGGFLLLMRLIFNPLEGKDVVEAAGGEVSRGFGLILSALAGIAAAVGGVLNFRASGGDFKDLGDINKLKSQFGGARAGAGPSSPPPPPPPAGGAVPPPPPPPSV